MNDNAERGWLAADEAAAASLAGETADVGEPHAETIAEISVSDFLRARALARAGITEHESEARRLHHVDATVRPMAVEPSAGGRRWRW